MNPPNHDVAVWDPLLRLFHWLLLASFCLAYFTEGDALEALQSRFDGEWLQAVHVWAGYAIGGLLLFRVAWGFLGPRHARFADFVQGPGVVAAYVKDVLLLRARRYLGHNPAGGAMIVLLLLGLASTVVSGVALYAADQGLGPLAAWLLASDDDLIHLLEETHETATHFTVLLIAGHVLGVVWESLLHRENLVRAMINGRKRR